jgi:hypothetical protein
MFDLFDQQKYLRINKSAEQLGLENRNDNLCSTTFADQIELVLKSDSNFHNTREKTIEFLTEHDFSNEDNDMSNTVQLDQFNSDKSTRVKSKPTRMNKSKHKERIVDGDRIVFKCSYPNCEKSKLELNQHLPDLII